MICLPDRMPKIIAVVRFNNHEAYVFNTTKHFRYRRHGKNLIVGRDRIFYNFFSYAEPSDGFAAFAGREFTLNLEGGEVVLCNGQWWSTCAESINGINLDICTVGWLNELLECYVYYGCCIESAALATLRADYRGKVYDCHEYGKILEDRKKGTT